jgi:glutathione synthase/RimK-type ligase-like ATP-grasp enzyme
VAAPYTIAFVTCAELLDLDPDDQHAVAALADRGVAVQAVAWDDPLADWSSYDLVVLRSPWDYTERHEQFTAWALTVQHLVNPATVVEWNIDKRYLAELAAAGIPVTPTTFVAPSDSWQPPAGDGEYVIKPSVSAGSRDTGRYGPASAAEAVAHMRRLQRDGRLVMVQPYLSAVDSHGETALLYFDGVFSHAIRKGPLLDGPDSGLEGLYKQEDITPRTATAAELAVGDAVVKTLPAGLLYARVDLIPDRDGNPLLLELELTEPSLFFGYAENAASRYADAILTRLPVRA